MNIFKCKDPKLGAKLKMIHERGDRAIVVCATDDGVILSLAWCKIMLEWDRRSNVTKITKLGTGSISNLQWRIANHVFTSRAHELDYRERKGLNPLFNAIPDLIDGTHIAQEVKFKFHDKEYKKYMTRCCAAAWRACRTKQARMDDLCSELLCVPVCLPPRFRNVVYILVFSNGKFSCQSPGMAAGFPRREFLSQCRALADSGCFGYETHVFETCEDLSTMTCLWHGCRIKTDGHVQICPFCEAEGRPPSNLDFSAATVQVYVAAFAIGGPERPPHLTKRARRGNGDEGKPKGYGKRGGKGVAEGRISKRRTTNGERSARAKRRKPRNDLTNAEIVAREPNQFCHCLWECSC